MKVGDAVKRIESESSLGGPRPEVREFYTETDRAEMNRYTVLFEQTSTGSSAHVPDLPGCVAAASTLDESRDLVRDAIEFHVEEIEVEV